MGFTEPLRQFFSSKGRQILEAAKEAGTNHAGLLGSHRELIIRDYLGALLPKRFAVGRGVVYGMVHRSREADVVVWDSHNYPALHHRGHSSFFAESTRLVIEAKSRWSEDEFDDMRVKCKAIKDIVPTHAPNLADDVAMLQLQVESLLSGQRTHGMLKSPHHVATAGLVLFGGASLKPSKLNPKWIDDADDEWPDVLLLLQQGRVVAKRYEASLGYMGGRGWLEFYDAGDDALLLFSALVMELLTERTVQIEDPSYLLRYVGQVLSGLVPEAVQFQPTRPVPQRIPLWSRV